MLIKFLKLSKHFDNRIYESDIETAKATLKVMDRILSELLKHKTDCMKYKLIISKFGEILGVSSKILQMSLNGGPSQQTILAFYNSTCDLSRKFKPIWMKLKQKFGDKYKYIAIDFADRKMSTTCAKFNYSGGHPELYMISNGNITSLSTIHG
jgi:hypothetical protein